MLNSLYIENFAIVSKLELDFNQGMTVFTGETGAGKSIMMDALLLALGGRADASVIRPGAEKCEIQATFTIDEDSQPAQWLQEQEVFQGEELFLRRIINQEGRSKSYINGQPFPLQKVKELSEMLVHIHGQHQHQTLLQHPTHRMQLDRYAKHSDRLHQVKMAYEHYEDIRRQIQTAHNQPISADTLELLQYQIDELDALEWQEGEIETLHTEHQLLNHARDYLNYIHEIRERLNSDDQLNVRQNLNQIMHLLGQLPSNNPHVQNTTTLIDQALIHCDEALDEMTHFASHVSLDPERLAIIEQRMSQLHQLARKFHVDVHQLSVHAENLKAERDRHLASENWLQELQEQLLICQKDYQTAANWLHDSRQKAAVGLAKEISQTIRQLGMPKAHFQIKMSPLDKIHSHGTDKVAYQVCTNPGMQPDDLSKIASGGELSRISLAIQMITAQRGTTPTLIFDEVDVGIGGATAALVGKLLRNLGERLQVFCVTHQPQVASCAHHHFVVEKYSQKDQTFSQVSVLSAENKIQEIARMLGGLKITEQTRHHAEELLQESVK